MPRIDCADGGGCKPWAGAAGCIAANRLDIGAALSSASHPHTSASVWLSPVFCKKRWTWKRVVSGLDWDPSLAVRSDQPSGRVVIAHGRDGPARRHLGRAPRGAAGRASRGGQI